MTLASDGVLAVVSLHETSVGAIRDAHGLARDPGAEVAVAGASEQPFRTSTDDP